MPPPPAVMIVAEIGEDREEPGRKASVWRKTLVLLIEAHEDFRHQVVCVGGVVQIAPRKGEERFLPPNHQPVQRGVVAMLEGFEIGVVVVGVRGH